MSDFSSIIALIETQKVITLAKGHFKNNKRRLQLAKDDFRRLGHLLNKKYEAVEELESDSVGTLFKSILGSKEEQLEMERQEYLQVVLQYNEAKKLIELLEYEQGVLKKQIKLEAENDLKLEAALKKHHDDILQAYPKVAAEVLSLEKKSADLAANNKEIEEALDVAKRLTRFLETIITNLDRASNWGDWEELKLSQKLQVKSKNLFVDKALSYVVETQSLLHKFEKELKDIQDHQDMIGTYHFHDFGNFTEVYYNRLIADWVIQKKIKNSKQNVEGVYDSVKLIMASLSLAYENAKKEMDKIKEDITFLIKSPLF